MAKVQAKGSQDEKQHFYTATKDFTEVGKGVRKETGGSESLGK